MKYDILNKQGVINRFKTIKSDKSEYKKYDSPRCVFPIFTTTIIGNCKRCNKYLESYKSDIDKHYFQAIKNKVRIMAEIGYDVTLELFCSNCIDNEINTIGFWKRFYKWKKVERHDNINCLFSIRFVGENKYHKVVSNDINDYNAVLSFLKNKPIWFGVNGESYILKEELNRVRRMLGIAKTDLFR